MTFTLTERELELEEQFGPQPKEPPVTQQNSGLFIFGDLVILKRAITGWQRSVKESRDTLYVYTDGGYTHSVPDPDGQRRRALVDVFTRHEPSDFGAAEAPDMVAVRDDMIRRLEAVNAELLRDRGGQVDQLQREARDLALERDKAWDRAAGLDRIVAKRDEQIHRLQAASAGLENDLNKAVHHNARARERLHQRLMRLYESPGQIIGIRNREAAVARLMAEIYEENTALYPYGSVAQELAR